MENHAKCCIFKTSVDILKLEIYLISINVSLSNRRSIGRTTFVASTLILISTLIIISICIFQVGGNFLVSSLSQNLLGVNLHLLSQLWTMALQPGASPLGEWQDGETVAMSLLGCTAGPTDPRHLHLASQVSR